jgi:hypothetical protein
MELPKFKRSVSREQIIANDPLGEFLVFWKDIRPTDADDLEAKLNSAKNERDMQSYLEEHPLLLIQHLGGGHGRWVIPQQRLGGQFVTDFVIAEKSSIGFEWVAVEIESPTAQIFTKKGDPSKTLNHAIRQISDWRAWLKRNQNYAARSREENGLGLTDIDSDIPGLIIIGREKTLNPNTRELRRQLGANLNIKIHTYDWLLRMARKGDT